ncbi:HEPN domain-containing protein [Candidatus Aerophobetes bacterium]|nr:HEPN domain-containing protein [Candidatus Aerophobetes bacterium]
MKQEFIDLARYRLEKARNTLSDAKKYINNATLESTVNRIYYAMFYAVNALLITKGLASSKHSGVLGLFNREVIKKGLIERRFGKFYSDMLNNRQEGDYKDFVKFEREDVEEWLKKAEEFIAKIEEITLKMIEERK